MDISLIIILVATVAVSIAGFGNAALYDRLKFNVRAIRQDREWYRIISSAFLHADWMHLIFNMLTLYFFAPYVIGYLGRGAFVVIYFAAVVVGSLLTLYVYRRSPGYSAIGASGGVSGILFAAVALEPHINIYLMFIPVGIPGWIFALLYLGYSIYGMQKSLGNIGHTAHLGGAVAGMAIAVGMHPATIHANTVVLLIMLVPIIVLAWLVAKKK